MWLRFTQLYALAGSPNEDAAQCAQADLFHEFHQFNYQIDMPQFEIMSPRQPPIPNGTYVAKIVSAKEKLSVAGHDMIVMKLALPDGQTIASILTFVPAARPVINAFCDSCELSRPAERGVSVELPARILIERYCYITITNDTDEDGNLSSHVTRFLTRAEALIKNPALAKIAVRQQPEIRLSPATNKSGELL
jgi:hypothetical protein